MNYRDYLEQHAGLLLLQMFGMAALGVFLAVTGSALSAVFLLLIVWGAVFLSYLSIGYYKKKKRYQEIAQTFEYLEEKYLFTDLMKEPKDPLEKLYFQCCQRACHQMMNRIEDALGESREYKEYMESWVHEIKNPLTAIELYERNHPIEEGGKAGKELKRMEELVNQVLYYARSSYVEKDYFIQKISLEDVVSTALLNHQFLILEQGISLETEGLEEFVYTDEKWLVYILGLLLSNVVKYVEKGKGILSIYVEKEDAYCILCVKDNGCGIAAADLPRVFEKGFTGTDRGKKGATGMGLYLTKRLCRKLGLSVGIQSEEGKGTIVKIRFPRGRFQSEVYENE